MAALIEILLWVFGYFAGFTMTFLVVSLNAVKWECKGMELLAAIFWPFVFFFGGGSWFLGQINTWFDKLASMIRAD